MPFNFQLATFNLQPPLRMPNELEISVNGTRLKVPAGTIVAGGIALAGISPFRHSVSGEPRGPLCGMGICMECRVTINGLANCRSCLIVCAEGMEIRTQ